MSCQGDTTAPSLACLKKMRKSVLSAAPCGAGGRGGGAVWLGVGVGTDRWRRRGGSVGGRAQGVCPPLAHCPPRASHLLLGGVGGAHDGAVQPGGAHGASGHGAQGLRWGRRAMRQPTILVGPPAHHCGRTGHAPAAAWPRRRSGSSGGWRRRPWWLLSAPDDPGRLERGRGGREGPARSNRLATRRSRAAGCLRQGARSQPTAIHGGPMGANMTAAARCLAAQGAAATGRLQVRPWLRYRPWWCITAMPACPMRCARAPTTPPCRHGGRGWRQRRRPARRCAAGRCTCGPARSRRRSRPRSSSSSRPWLEGRQGIKRSFPSRWMIVCTNTWCRCGCAFGGSRTSG